MSNTCNNSCFVLRQQSAVYLELCLSSRVLCWTVSEYKQKWRIHWWELSFIHFSCKCNYSILLHNKTPIYSAWGLLRVCAACPTPRLNHSYELCPPCEQHLRYIPHRVRNGYNTTLWTQSKVCKYINKFIFSCPSVGEKYSDVLMMKSVILCLFSMFLYQLPQQKEQDTLRCSNGQTKCVFCAKDTFYSNF